MTLQLCSIVFEIAALGADNWEFQNENPERLCSVLIIDEGKDTITWIA
ncbi:MAG: hypothetical protein ACLU62_10530 [Hydrogeniiclostridium sp.]